MKKKIAILSLILLVLAFPIAAIFSAETVTVYVKDKERIVTGSGENVSSKFLVYTDKEVFQNVDAIEFLKFNSADIQGSLDRDSTYKVKVAGWRIPFLSTYRNIVKIEE